ncbi:hypothetical protein EDB81DRAFT_495878 [Dactylonectria macrodidyma]|uniref:Uncharacterized protein n=1 Tax=Dactylonectria macrodidyma TaxID=307937 RepID=A0A9P9EWG4_9HYPO|nr:hypothetical protein EDB81DRAFT_495878 [Dactylonectria macrodidyma]
MITTGWQSPTSQDPNHEGNSLARALLFCTTRARRGGFRIVLQIAAALLTIFILFGLLPERMGGGLSNYKDILTWKAEPEQQIANLRIVVFGSPDVAGSAVDEDHVRTTWTEELCKQMNCTSHISYVPGGESNHGMVSNPAYAHEVTALDRVTGSTNITDKPALDYNFINEQYPVPTGTPDLADQIKTFLATPPADTVPHETLWIFTFGTWEVWNLAALPLETAEGLIDTMVLDIFAQIEHLYKHALYPDSVAFSDFWSNATDSQIDELTAPNAASKVDDRKLESFRVLIPKLFDITLTPGWRGRAVPPFPNTEAEQTRNAVWLTRHWNEAMDLAFSAWKDKRAQKPDGVIEETDEHVVQRREEESGSFRPKSLFDYLPAYMRSKSLNATEAAAERVINAPYPLRNGIQVNTAKVILDAITEEEMQRSEVRDSQGRGTMGVNDTMRFLDVWTPCVRATTEDLTVDMDEVTEECSIPHDHLFYDAFTIGQRAIIGVTEPILESVLEHLFVRQPKSSWFY